MGTNGRDAPIVVTLPARLANFLDELLETTLFGQGYDYCVERLVCEQIRNLIAEGTLTSEEDDD